VCWRVHEHFEPISNAAWRRQRVFQQPASLKETLGLFSLSNKVASPHS
jgi:hypothetical protein